MSIEGQNLKASRLSVFHRHEDGRRSNNRLGLNVCLRFAYSCRDSMVHVAFDRCAMVRLSVACFLSLLSLFSVGGIRSAHSQATPAGEDYYTRIQPIFDNRCVACHSCSNAPCQLNLQSYSGLTRGATKPNVYDASRPKSVFPTRLDIDGHSVADWRAKGFFDVMGARDPARTLLTQLVGLRARHPGVQPKKSAGESNFCPVDSDSV